jgi:hypothetical protein
MHQYINWILSFGSTNIILWMLNGFVWSFAWTIYMKIQMKYEENKAVLLSDLLYSLILGPIGGYMWAPWCILWMVGCQIEKSNILKKKLF